MDLGPLVPIVAILSGLLRTQEERVLDAYLPLGFVVESLQPAVEDIKDIANRGRVVKGVNFLGLRDAGLVVWVTVIESVPEAMTSMRRLLTGPLDLDAVDWLVFHQASNVVLDTLTNLLDFDPAQLVAYCADLGEKPFRAKLEAARADCTEVWAPRALLPLIRFAERTRAIADTGLDLVGVLPGIGPVATIAMLLPITYALQQQDWKAGSYKIGYQSCDDSTARIHRGGGLGAGAAGAAADGADV